MMLHHVLRVFHDVLLVVHDVLLVVHDVLLVVHDVSQCFTSVSWYFTIFNNVLRWLASRTMIGIADRLRDRDTAMIGNNSAELGGRNRRWPQNHPYHSESDSIPMLNSVLNRDWSNSVPWRQIPKGTLAGFSCGLHFSSDPMYNSTRFARLVFIIVQING